MDMNEYMDAFVGEMQEHLGALNQNLMQLEQNPDDKNLINEIFRSAHTMKGVTGAMGFSRMAALTHGMEDVLHGVREGKTQISSALINILFVCLDVLENSLTTVIKAGNEESIDIDEILEKLHSVSKENGNISSGVHGKRASKSDITSVKVDPSSVLELTHTEASALDEALQAGLHPYRILVTLDKACALKSARLFMLYQVIEKSSKIIKTKPDIEEIKSGKTEPLMLTALIASENISDDFINELKAIMEVQKVVSSPVEAEKTSDAPAFNLKLASEDDNASEKSDLHTYVSMEISGDLLKEFLSELDYQIKNIEKDMSAFKADPDNNAILQNIYSGFHTISGLAGYFEHMQIQTVAHYTSTLIAEGGRKNISNQSIPDLASSSLEYITKLRKDASMNKNKDFLNQMDEHIKLLKNKAGINIKSEDSLSANSVTQKSQDADNINRGVISADSGYTRVSINKIDSLVDMMGELLITQSLIEQEAVKRFGNNDIFTNGLLRMARITRDIQNISMSLRMVSLKSTFQKLTRLGRDTSKELDKNINIVVKGEDTEIDRGAAEKLLDPLLHIIKNSISHGIEEEDERVRKGKPAQGLVEITACSKRGSVYIEVSDDGRGISIDKVYQKALDKKLIDPSVKYSDEEIIDFIFFPGFSTAENIDNISGRGVGLDVVRTEISKVGGKVEIINQPGIGCKFVLKIPINLAIMNGTIVNILGSNYIIPTLNIKQIIKPAKEQWITVKGKISMIKVRDEIIPLIPISKILGFNNNEEPEELVLIMELEQKLKALPVQSIIGKHEIVVKPLGKEFSGLNFVSGASILGDGKVSLIMDVENLFKMEMES